MTFPYFTKIGILIDFKVNQDFIAEVLCMNKDKPEMACNGQCYLARQFRKTEERKDKPVPASKTEQLEWVYCCSDQLFDSSPFFNFQLDNLHVYRYLDLYKRSYVADVFRPPNFLIR